ncbi:MAG TPA: type II secretion system protein [Nitrosomonas sp.]|nr:type II secretion system protein [Nitrosomonas sp.]
MRTGNKACSTQDGFTYLILLFSIAILGIGLATTGVIWSTESRLAKERELEFIGQEFVRAIESYYNATPGEVKTYPQTLEDLVNDTRFLFTKRHLRKIYTNPFTKKIDWDLINNPQGGITGIEANTLYSSTQLKKRKFIFEPNK